MRVAVFLFLYPPFFAGEDLTVGLSPDIRSRMFLYAMVVEDDPLPLNQAY